tara:strand:- start:907 stop:1701 length:795 start_codon:yes stop_codon:yes gene_type:complete
MIGLIFGETDFPKQILRKIKHKKLRHIIIDLSKNKIFKSERHSYSFSLGQFGKIISKLKKNGCKKILFAGKVKKPIFSKLRLDLKGVLYMHRIIKSSKLGDAAILKEVIKIFEKEKIKTISSLSFSPELTLKKGIYTKIKPNNSDKKDIKKAISILNKLGKYDYSQGTVVRNEKILAVEDSEGTQKMLKKCKNNKFKNKGVLVKFPKKKQDLRVDLPTVGLKTLIHCKLAGLKGIVLKNKQNVFLEKKKCISFANKNNMFILSK